MGLAGMILTRGGEFDTQGDAIPNGNDRDIELVVTDRTFTSDGQMYFPERYDPNNQRRAYLGPQCGEDTCNGLGPSDIPRHWVPGYLGDVNIVNGAAWPVLKVAAGCYRFRFLNAALARFYNYTLDADLPMTVIGFDNGFLDPENVQEVDWVLNAPGERTELLIDFSDQQNKEFILKNVGECTQSDYQQDTIGKVLKFMVTDTVAPSCPSLGELRSGDPEFIPRQPAQVDPEAFEQDPDPTQAQFVQLLAAFSQTVITNSATGTNRPNITEICDVDTDNVPGTNEDGIPVGFVPAITFLLGNQTGPQMWSDPTNNYVEQDIVAEWTIRNPTATPHPIHIHLGGFKVMKRVIYNHEMTEVKWDDVQPLPWEKGWGKDTILAYQYTDTIVRTRFTKGGAFVYHCHILMHEDKDMMRPLCVLNKDGSIPETCTFRDEHQHCEKPKAKDGKSGKSNY
jgi:spore coat protein A